MWVKTTNGLLLNLDEFPVIGCQDNKTYACPIHKDVYSPAVLCDGDATEKIITAIIRGSNFLEV